MASNALYNDKDVIAVAIGVNDHGKRIDRLLRARYRDLPLSAIYRLVRSGKVRVNGKRIAVGMRLAADDLLTVRRAALLQGTPRATAGAEVLQQYRAAAARQTPTAPTGRSLRYVINQRVGAVCFENTHVLALNKCRGAALFVSDDVLCCQEEVRRYLASDPDADWGAGFMPAALHRLDRNTSGILCFSKSLHGAQVFSALLHDRRLQKEYLALVEGRVNTAAVWSEALVRIRPAATDGKGAGGGRQSAPASRAVPADQGADTAGEARSAQTAVQPLAYGRDCTLICATIESGRYHQIRAHAALHHHPLIGDLKYGGQQREPQYLLHATRIHNSEAATADDSDFDGGASRQSAAALFRSIACPLSREQRQWLGQFVRVDRLADV